MGGPTLFRAALTYWREHGREFGNSGDIYEQAVVKTVAGAFSREFHTSTRRHPVRRRGTVSGGSGTIIEAN
jgi:hypothetical protein